MAYKIFTRGNYFYIVSSPGRELSAPAKDVRISRTATSTTSFGIEGVVNWDRNQFLDISEIQDESGVAYTTATFIEFYETSTGEAAKSSITGNQIMNLASNDLGKDAWGRPKVINDNSILHGMFTYNVPVSVWYETINSVVQSTFTNCSSVDGALVVEAGATLNDVTRLSTYRHPRYEPNRGFLYSTASFIDNPTADMNRSFGVGTDESGVFFRLESGTLYGVIRTTRNSITTEDKIVLDVAGVDLSKGNVFDIQYQWRGVGNYRFFINLLEVGNSNYLGTLTELSMYNPANPLMFESENLGDNNTMSFGCVDVSSEGGKDNGKIYGSTSINNTSGQVAITGFNIPIMVVRSKLTVNSLINTRDTLALLASAYADNKAFLRVWATRDATAITVNDQTWSDFGDGHLEKLIYNLEPNGDALVGVAMTFDTSKADLIFGCRVGQDDTYATSALFEGRTEIYQTPGDIFIFTMHRENGVALNCGVTYEFAEEI